MKLPYCVVMLVKPLRDENPFWKSIDTGNNKKKTRQSLKTMLISIWKCGILERERAKKKFD